ncbi:MAG: DMT family transporter [Rhodocyclaceae bacterium]|nr:DMT family transporter [Rhodocyclaceae bacterium]MDZ4215893.1 DMT family transporter [Rhodocyclaceae bacterium]
MLAKAAPFLFVLLWSTGFLGAKFGLPHAEPLAFLFVRYLLVIALMTSLALAWRAPWPKDRGQWLQIGISGLLVHALYLGGVFVAIGMGLPAGITALVVGLQPLLTATVAGRLLGEAVLPRQWLGLGLGFVGVALVVAHKIGAGFALDALWPAFAALLGITAGTLYQKRFSPHFDWRSGSVAQFLPTAIVTGALVFATDSFRIEWTGEFVFALGWLVLVLSIGAISLLNWLIRHGSAVNVASLFYLTPPTTALLAWLLFGETLSGLALVGMALAVSGVYIARR